MSPYCVYVITHTATGRAYVGKTDSPLRRVRQHIRRSEGRSKKVQAIHLAIAKHGPKAFTFRVLEWFDDEDECLRAETRWIRALNAVRPGGFNLSEGGRGGKSPCAEVRAKIAAKRTGKRHSAETKAAMSAKSMGKTMPDSMREKMRIRSTGRVFTDETRTKLRAAMERRRAAGPTKRELAAREAFRSVNVGRKLSDETKRRMAESHTGQKRSAESRARISAAKQGRTLDPEVKRLRLERMRAKKAAKQAALSAEKADT